MYYNFRKDLEASQIGVEIAKAIAKEEWPKSEVKELCKKEQYLGDIQISDVGTVEVKTDFMSHKTGNLCFESSNSKRNTGIFSTEADEVWYVAPTNDSYEVFRFSLPSLLGWLNDPKNKSNIRFVKGGDRGKFSLRLVKKEIARTIAYDIVEVSNAQL